MTADLVPAQRETRDDRINDLTDQFIATRKSDHTRSAYRLDLGSWWAWCKAAGLHPAEAWPGDILAWLATLGHEAGTTRARRLGAVSSWYQWLIRHQAAERNPALVDRAERPVRAPRKAPALSDAQTEQMLAAADADTNPRSAAIVWTLLTTGIRVGELISANVADIGQDRGVSVLHVHGKGGKTRMVEVEPYTLSRIDRYLSSRTDLDRRPVPLDQAGAGSVRPLIATASDHRIDRKEVRRLLRRLARQASLPDALIDWLTPHSTRATFVTTSLDGGAPLRDVQLAVGHASPVTTEGYDRSAWSPDRSPARLVAKRFHAARVDATRDPGARFGQGRNTYGLIC